MDTPSRALSGFLDAIGPCWARPVRAGHAATPLRNTCGAAHLHRRPYARKSPQAASGWKRGSDGGGELVSTPSCSACSRPLLASRHGHVFILDGYPRNLAQADAWMRARSCAIRSITRCSWMPADLLVERIAVAPGQGRADAARRRAQRCRCTRRRRTGHVTTATRATDRRDGVVSLDDVSPHPRGDFPVRNRLAPRNTAPRLKATTALLGIAGTFMGASPRSRANRARSRSTDQAVYPPMSTQLEHLGTRCARATTREYFRGLR